VGCNANKRRKKKKNDFIQVCLKVIRVIERPVLSDTVRYKLTRRLKSNDKCNTRIEYSHLQVVCNKICGMLTTDALSAVMETLSVSSCNILHGLQPNTIHVFFNTEKTHLHNKYIKILCLCFRAS
jgi:hypothetical protein